MKLSTSANSEYRVGNYEIFVNDVKSNFYINMTREKRERAVYKDRR